MHAYGHSLLPHLLALRRPSVVTVHEASLFGRFTGRGMLLPMLLRSHLIFTSDFERRFTRRWAPWIRSRAFVVPLGSNIRAVLARATSPRTIVAFGGIYRGKGLDEVIEFARLAAAANAPWEVRVVGSSEGEASTYERSLHEHAAGLPVHFTGRVDDEAVAKELARATLGYFPFRDGASERRGSLLAALAAGLPVITTAGRHTTQALRDATVIANSPAEALAAADRLVLDAAERERLSAAGRAYAAARTWERIAERHVRIYERMLQR